MFKYKFQSCSKQKYFSYNTLICIAERREFCFFQFILFFDEIFVMNYFFNNLDLRSDFPVTKHGLIGQCQTAFHNTL